MDWLVTVVILLTCTGNLISGANVHGPSVSPPQHDTCMTAWLRIAFPTKNVKDLRTYERVLRELETPVDANSITTTSPFLLSFVFGGQDSANHFSRCTSGQCSHPTPCHHGGRCIFANITSTNCIAHVKDYQCVCNPGYTGRLCQNALSVVCSARNPCQNGGTCQTIGQTSYRCRCKYLFRGRHCQNYWLQDEVRGIASEIRDFEQRLVYVEEKASQSAADRAQTLSTFMKSLQSKVDESLSSMHASQDKRLDEIEKLSLRLGQDVLSSLPTSCKDLQSARRNVSLPSGLYKIVSSQGSIIEVYCDMERYWGGWTRIAYMNPAEQRRCAGAMHFQDLQVPVCRRPVTVSQGCSMATYPSMVGDYREVMGFVTGYRMASMDAFAHRSTIPLRSYYVDGVSITYGSPMQHLWTYAASFDDHVHPIYHCPCSARPGQQAPAFVGDHYYCADRGNVYRKWSFTAADHAWSNTSECGSGSSCCDSPDMPWFHRQLDTKTSEKIQIRVCSDQAASHEDVAIDEATIFVK
ncbi:uncharacterized protein LOC135811393 [Sycon ciliatum]|uniref:uncharacterized protein LOC135811393 n=1 Tax=Sycon ciliatum TaxID=27933 RepID=UPI0031F6757F